MPILNSEQCQLALFILANYAGLGISAATAGSFDSRFDFCSLAAPFHLPHTGIHPQPAQNEHTPFPARPMSLSVNSL